MFTKLMIAMIVAALVSIYACTPVMDIWREEMAGALTGRFKPPHGHPSDSVKFQFGPHAVGPYTWGGSKDAPLISGLGSYIQFGRNSSGDLVANTTIRDRDGHLLVEVINNEWRVANAAWEKNYTDNALEVKDGDGRVVFQLFLLADRAEIQAEWWDRDGNGFRIVEVKDKPDSQESEKMGWVMVKMTRAYHPDDPAIQPMFKYPSKKYFGQLREQ